MRLQPTLALLSLTLLLTSPALAQPRAGEVTIVAAGAAPTRPLRHRFGAGMTQRLRLRIQTQMRIQLGDRDQTIPVPIMRLDLALGPTRIVHGNHLGYGFRVTGVGVEGDAAPEMLERVRAQLQGIVGLHGTAEVDDRGSIVDFAYELPADASEQLRNQSGMLRQSLTQLLPRFPVEPVGVGAEWRIHDQLELPQTRVSVATTYRLTRWEGDLIELDIRTGTVEGGAQPEGTALTVTGSGRTRFEIGSLRVRGRIETAAMFEASGQSDAMRMRVRTRTQITPR